MLKRGLLLLTMLVLVGMVLGGGFPGPRVASADCIDGCNWQANECRSYCCPEDWYCFSVCDEQHWYCISHCSP